MERWAVQFAYDGRGYAGWARQPGQRTVEGALLHGLVRCGIVSSAESARLTVASRTDRGVSARANVLAVSAKVGGTPLLRALNGIAPDILFTAAAPVPDAFQPRHALWRHYRYFEPAHDRRGETWRELAPLLEGRVDVRTFGRGFSGASPVFREVESVRVRTSPRLITVDVRAPRFVWGMVRKMVAALGEVDAGRLTSRQLTDAVNGTTPRTLPLAPAERLVLWRVRVPLPWTVRSSSLQAAQERTLRARLDDLATGRAITFAIYPSERRGSRRDDTRTSDS